MTEACVAITRGGVTYQIPRATPREPSNGVHWLSVAGQSFRAPQPDVAQNGNGGPASPGSEVLALLRSSLDLTDQDDLRAGAILAVLCAGVRKNELLSLDVADLSEVDGVMRLRIRRAHEQSRVKERVVPLAADAASLLRRYRARERLSQQAADAPLFWTLGRHGRCRRTRITGHAVNYWLEQLRRRAGIEERLTSRTLRKPARPATVLLTSSSSSARKNRSQVAL